MNKLLTLPLVAFAVVAGCGDDDDTTASGTTTGSTSAATSGSGGAGAGGGGATGGGGAAAERPAQVWIANRGAGEIAIVDDENQAVSAFAMPNAGEPMYANYAPIGPEGIVIVGDRANDAVVVFDATTHDVVDTLTASDGVFHQWISGDTLAVNADVDRETLVYTVAPSGGTLDATIPMPTDLAMEAAAKPHDVFVSDDGTSVYVTYIGFSMASWVVRFAEDDQGNWSEAVRAQVGGDAHLYLDGDDLYVPCQDSNEVHVLDAATLASETVLSVPGAHGLTLRDGFVYVGNISDDMSDVVAVIQTSDDTIVQNGGALLRPPTGAMGAPHNLWFNAAGDRLYLTHSGPTSTFVSTYAVSGATITPGMTIDVEGANPFGLTFVPAKP